jgi:hypothetical protein
MPNQPNDSFVGVAPDGPGPSGVPPGKNMDMSQVTTGSGVVQRERVSIGDPQQGGNLANVDPVFGLNVVNLPVNELLVSILVELRVLNNLLKQGSTSAINDDLDQLRRDALVDMFAGGKTIQ